MSETPFRVVIAEDEALIRLDLKEMLEEEGYAVVGEAGDGETAVKLAERTAAGSGDHGHQDAGAWTGSRPPSRSGRAPVAPVVILTAFSQRDLVERARAAGAMAYLVKPFQKTDLVPAIEMAVSRFAEMRRWSPRSSTSMTGWRTRKLVERAKGDAADPARDDRAGGLPVDPAHRDGPPPDHARRGRGSAAEAAPERTTRPRRAGRSTGRGRRAGEAAPGPGGRVTRRQRAARRRGTGCRTRLAGKRRPARARLGGHRAGQAGGTGCTTPVLQAGARPLVPLPALTQPAAGEPGKPSRCHVSLPRACTFSTRLRRALPHHRSDASPRRAKAWTFAGRYGLNVP